MRELRSHAARQGITIELVEEGKDGHMVSVSGQLDLHYVPFHELVNPASLRTEVRLIEVGSDFHQSLMETIYTEAARIADRAVSRPGTAKRFDMDRAIAEALNCLAPVEGDACGTCRASPRSATISIACSASSR